jgi:NAD(P)-dependent dehydrogenase (short-subunit alcohol dehydrogenase family)
MADAYIPAAAQHLGSNWVSDRLCFAEVTIATARLQALVRAIGTRWGGDPAHLPGRRSVLMIVPDTEQHTLGAVVATGQMRRMGLSEDLAGAALLLGSRAGAYINGQTIVVDGGSTIAG